MYAQEFKRIQCIKGDEEYGLVEGGVYTLIDVTKDGNYRLLELDPPEPFNCFDKIRFVSTQETVLVEFEENTAEDAADQEFLLFDNNNN